MFEKERERGERLKDRERNALFFDKVIFDNNTRPIRGKKKRDKQHEFYTHTKKKQKQKM